MYNFLHKIRTSVECGKNHTGKTTDERQESAFMFVVIFIYVSTFQVLIIKTYFELNLLTMILWLCLLYHKMLFEVCFAFPFLLPIVGCIMHVHWKTFKVILIPEECSIPSKIFLFHQQIEGKSLFNDQYLIPMMDVVLDV